ncbi:GTP pyrophosphokinase [Herbaspirillum sp. B65]|uniref:GTP pyrophosphokinase n=1 Tax=Herbaspirillum sp. B65 TaxID=137708 RepID=UPI00034DA45C|nr:hypothetical protein [Herbaspirillum sp. B65]
MWGLAGAVVYKIVLNEGTAMQEQGPLSPEQLKERVIRFYNRYGKDLEQIKSLLEIRLTQLALAYTIDNKLPPEAVKVSTRVKGINSFMKKLEKKGWPQFYYPTDVAGDLIGARVVCWFLDDCHGFLKLISGSQHLKIEPSIEDYITNPKPSGYRSIHLVANISYDGVKRTEDQEIIIASQDMRCEIQVRTKLQDAWGDVTHDFHYKAKEMGVEDEDLEGFLNDVAQRLASEDKTLIKFRKTYQRLADEKSAKKIREGFQVSASAALPKFFLSQPEELIETALVKAESKNRLVFAVIYDADKSSKSKLEYSLGYFLEYGITKTLVDENFIAALVPVSKGNARDFIPEDDPLENCRLVVFLPNGKVLRSEGVYANPDEGLRRVRTIVEQWKSEV